MMRIALAQLISGPEPEENLALIEDFAARAAAAGAELTIFPEATMRCFGLPLASIAEPVDGPWANQVREIAGRHQLIVVTGMFCPSGDGRLTNTLLVTGNGVEAHYDKIHIFDAYGFAESDTVAPGAEPVLIEVSGVKVGLTTCYDVRFPHLYTRLADQGAELICISASWGAGPGKVDQWDLLVRARALDSTSFIAACGQADPATRGIAPRGGAPTGVGHSAVISPGGEVLSRAGTEPELLIVDIDPAQVAETRRILPVLANRRI